MARVFLASDHSWRTPLTIVARDNDEAFRMAYLWSQAHAPDVFEKEIGLTELFEDDLAFQPQLADFAKSGGVGVAWWTGEHDGWLLGAPDGAALGEIAPPSPDLQIYAFQTMEPGGTYVVAESGQHALELLNVYSHRTNGWPASYHQVLHLSAWLLHGRVITLRDEAFAGRTGVGRECKDGFYRVLAAWNEIPAQKRNGGIE
ncbi:hypothetical protein [Novosphingobium huizhouense]|uniref:hypothetical protein n=1 Tax=Novosphingobium huizhouense TaxID=2866625 RepID=UPI001CD8DDD0|nr:hypothetical protein [Novosphingobium huizhouense]